MVFVIALVGLLIGSFVGALTYRLPRGQGFVKGRSYCDFCKQKLEWKYNIPVFSYLVLKGRSVCCGKKISLRYPLIELASVLGAIVLYPNIIFIILYLLTLAIFIIDLEQQIIPDELSWLVLLLGLLTVHSLLFTALFSGFFASLLLLTIHLITKGKGMGLGDVKLSIALGIWLGWSDSLTWLITSFILGGIISAILLLLRKANLKTKIAFGPFLILSFWIVLIYAKIF